MVSPPRSGGTDGDTCRRHFVAMSREAHDLTSYHSVCKDDLDQRSQMVESMDALLFFLNIKMTSKIQIYFIGKKLRAHFQSCPINK